MKLNNNQQSFIALIKAGLWNNEVRLLQYKTIDFKEILRIAEEQSLVGLLAEGIEYIEDIQVSQEDVLTIVGKALQLEQQNLAINVLVARLFVYLREKGISPLLMKGQGIAQCYNRSLWRTSGDVDLLLKDGDYQKAKELLLPFATSVETEYTTFKHLGMSLRGFMVELHGCLHTRLSKRIDTYLDFLQDEIFRDKKFRIWCNRGEMVHIPAPEYDIIFVFTHILHHFYVEGIGLRQICDWCRLLWTYRTDIDLELLKSRLSAMGILTEWKSFAAFSVKYLGISTDAMPLFSPSRRWCRKANRIMDFVLKTGNFGHNRQQSQTKGQSLCRKVKDFGQHILIFPVDSVKFFFSFVCDGLQLAANKNEYSINTDITTRLKDFIEAEARSCSMEPGCITPEYVYRMWGGTVALDEIKKAMRDVRGL